MRVAVLLMGLVLSGLVAQRGCCRFRRRRTGRVRVRRRAGDRRVSDEQASEPTVVEEARAALEAGVPWRARDLLAAHVIERDPEALALLAQVHHDMGDLPRAGAIWFAAGRRVRTSTRRSRPGASRPTTTSGHVALAPGIGAAQPRRGGSRRCASGPRRPTTRAADAASTDGGGDDVEGGRRRLRRGWLVA